MSFESTQLEIIRWAEQKKIIPNSTPTAQFMKAVSEMGELSDALTKNDMDYIRDSVGDVLVCLINMCALLDINIVSCLDGSYEEIKNRKGTMLPSGVFLKE